MNRNIAFEKIRKEFPVLDQYVYANTAAGGLLYDSLLDWRQEHDLDYMIGGSNFRANSSALCNETRKSIARFFGGTVADVALVPNFSLGLNMLLDGLDKNNKVLLLKNDYPSVNWPFELRGFQTFYVDIMTDLESGISEIIEKEKIDVLALSIVQWLDGVKIDLDFLKQLKNQHPNLLIIADGTQFCGTSVFDFTSSGIDVFGASAYKWLLAGYGCGFFLVKDAVQSRFSLKATGLHSANNDASATGPVSFCAQLEPGHLDTLTFGSLRFSLNFLAWIGLEQIEEQLQLLSEKAKMEFADLGLLNETVLKRKGHSSIFNIKGGDALFHHLTKNNVICSLRGEGIRLSFHFYNTEKDIDSIVNLVKKQ